MTITGRNLAPTKNSNTVFFGNGVTNVICEILSISDTQVVCTVPRMSEDFTIGEQLEVAVTGRLIEESVCTGTCAFTYQTQTQNQIVVPTNTIFKNGQTVTVQAGAGGDLTGATVEIDGVSCTINSATASQLSFVFPNISAG